MVAVGVLTHSADQADVAAEPAGSNGLVGALAAGIDGEAVAVDRLAGLREPLAVDGEVGVEGSDDDDSAVGVPAPAVGFIRSPLLQPAWGSGARRRRRPR